MKKFLFLVLSIIVVLLVCFNFSFVDHECYFDLEENFVIDKPYFSVVKSLATKESLEKAVEQGNGILRNKEWKSFIVEVPKRVLRLKEYKLEGTLNFTVIKNDSGLGNLALHFQQDVDVDKNVFRIKTFLRDSNDSITLYNKFIYISPSLNSLDTQVKVKSELGVKKRIPFFLVPYMDNKVSQSNKDDLLNLKSNIISITQDTSPVIQFKRSEDSKFKFKN